MLVCAIGKQTSATSGSWSTRDTMSTMNEPRQSFWMTLPGILTGIAALITAVGTTYAVVKRVDASQTGETDSDIARAESDVGPEQAENSSGRRIPEPSGKTAAEAERHGAEERDRNIQAEGESKAEVERGVSLR